MVRRQPMLPTLCAPHPPQGAEAARAAASGPDQPHWSSPVRRMNPLVLAAVCLALPAAAPSTPNLFAQLTFVNIVEPLAAHIHVGAGKCPLRDARPAHHGCACADARLACRPGSKWVCGCALSACPAGQLLLARCRHPGLPCRRAAVDGQLCAQQQRPSRQRPGRLQHGGARRCCTGAVTLHGAWQTS